MALRNWGAEHLDLATPLGPLAHADCGGEVRAHLYCEACSGEVTALEVRGGPGAPAAV